jgi:methionyl-tRNA formyltransferase
VHDQLALLGPGVIGEVLARHAAGTLVGEVQDESRATRARKLSKAEATIDLSAVSAAVARARINGLNSWPGCTVRIGDVSVKLLRVEECGEACGEACGATGDASLLEADGVVRAAVGAIRVLEVQPVGGKAMTIGEFLNGRPRLVGCAVRPIAPEGV